MGSIVFTCEDFHRFVIISDAKLAREAYSDAALSARPDFKLFNLLSDGNHGNEVVGTNHFKIQVHAD